MPNDEPTPFAATTRPAAVSGLVRDHLGVPGLLYKEDLLDAATQSHVLAEVDARPWQGELRRRVQHYGYRYDYKARAVDTSMRLGPLPDFGLEVARLAIDAGLLPATPDQLIVNEYQPGQGIAAHVDCEPCFLDVILTVSLGWAYEMDYIDRESREVRPALLPAGSGLTMTGDARYRWLHRIRPRLSDRGVPRGRRVSLTYRYVNLRGDSAAAANEGDHAGRPS